MAGVGAGGEGSGGGGGPAVPAPARRSGRTRSQPAWLSQFSQDEDDDEDDDLCGGAGDGHHGETPRRGGGGGGRVGVRAAGSRTGSRAQKRLTAASVFRRDMDASGPITVASAASHSPAQLTTTQASAAQLGPPVLAQRHLRHATAAGQPGPWAQLWPRTQ